MSFRAIFGTLPGSAKCHVGLWKVLCGTFQGMCLSLSDIVLALPDAIPSSTGVVWGSCRHFEGLSNLLGAELSQTLLRALLGIMHAYPTCCIGFPKVLRGGMAEAACSFPRRYTGFFQALLGVLPGIFEELFQAAHQAPQGAPGCTMGLWQALHRAS